MTTIKLFHTIAWTAPKAIEALEHEIREYAEEHNQAVLHASTSLVYAEAEWHAVGTVTLGDIWDPIESTKYQFSGSIPTMRPAVNDEILHPV
jgi:hypothetical protein